MHVAAWRCGYPADSIDFATGAAGAVQGYLYPFISPALAGSRLAAHARPGDSDISGVLPAARLPFCHSPGPRGRAAHSVRHGHGTTRRGVDCRCAASGPSSILSLTRSHRAAGSGHPHCHGTRCRLCRCAASGQSSQSVTRLAAGSGRPHCEGTVSTVQVCCLRPVFRSVTHWAAGSSQCYDCWCPASGLLPPCLPSGPAGVDVTPTRIPTSRADSQ